ncbi:SRPBCC family protein [Flavobacterium sp. WC2509]|uniref:SRPBCC family protein n=1 Tax=Flavobacterium sp. WC2509 TaxID=3461406 RepID=UPI0040447E6D
MNSNLTFDFTVNKETNTVYVKKEFAAKPDLVWDAYTKPELLDQWWAPKPWLSKTKSMEFKEGGRRLYAMCGPEGEEHWALADFISITPKTSFKFSDAFCDAAGNLNIDMPRSDWDVDFVDKGDSTLVNITIKHKTLADLEKIISFGFKEGFTMALNNLDEIFANS